MSYEPVHRKGYRPPGTFEAARPPHATSMVCSFRFVFGTPAEASPLSAAILLRSAALSFWLRASPAFLAISLHFAGPNFLDLLHHRVCRVPKLRIWLSSFQKEYMETSRSGKVSDFFGMRLTEYVKTCDVNL
jgi:hypothetical protein